MILSVKLRMPKIVNSYLWRCPVSTRSPTVYLILAIELTSFIFVDSLKDTIVLFIETPVLHMGYMMNIKLVSGSNLPSGEREFTDPYVVLHAGKRQSVHGAPLLAKSTVALNTSQTQPTMLTCD